MLRKLFTSLAGSESKSSGNVTPRIDLVTIGGGGSGTKRSWKPNKYRYEADSTVLATATGEEEDRWGKGGWDKGGCEKDSAKERDDESTRNMIRVTGRFERSVSMRDLGREFRDGKEYHGF